MNVSKHDIQERKMAKRNEEEKGKGKVHLITCYEGKQGVQVQLYSLFNLGTGWGWVINIMPWPLYPLE